MVVQKWELDVEFNPLRAVQEKRHGPTWISWRGSPHLAPDNDCIDNIFTADFVKYLCKDPKLLSVEKLSFRNPEQFVAGQLHSCVDSWENLLSAVDDELSERVKSWIVGGVDVFDFFQHFKGKFKGVDYDSVIPHDCVYKNSVACQGFEQFIAETLMDRIRNGSVELLGKVGQVQPPKVVLGLVVEPSKPRMVVDCILALLCQHVMKNLHMMGCC